jgi:hypothetical protein
MSRKPGQMLAIGPLSSNSTTMRHHIANGHTFERPQKVCNSLQPNMTQAEAGRLQMLSPPARPGSDDHRRYSSKGSI